jgi:hypothetical protein
VVLNGTRATVVSLDSPWFALSNGMLFVLYRIVLRDFYLIDVVVVVVVVVVVFRLTVGRCTGKY